MDRIYHALQRAGVNADFIPSSADFTPYKAVFAPDLYILPDSVAHALSQYVKNGGVLFADSRTGVKDESSLCHARTLPGLLSEALGIVIDEYESLSHSRAGEEFFTYQVKGVGSFTGSYTATRTCEWIQPQTAETLAGYEEWHLQSYAAATRNPFGQGWGYFVGTL